LPVKVVKAEAGSIQMNCYGDYAELLQHKPKSVLYSKASVLLLV